MSQVTYAGSSAAGNRVLIQTKTASASSAIQFTSGVTGYDRYELDMYGVTQSGNNNISLQLSTDGGSTWVGTGYYLSGDEVTSNGVRSAFNQQNAANLIISTGQSNSATSPLECYIKFSLLGSTTFFKNMQFKTTDNNTGGNWTSATGILQTTSACTAIQIFPAAGSFTTGTFKLYGIAQ